MDSAIERLARWDQIVVAIRAEVDRLGSDICRLCEVENEWYEKEAKALIDGKEPSIPSDHPDQIRTEMTVRGRRLAAIRSELAKQAPALTNALDAINAGLPEHEQSVIDSFEADWDKTLAEYESVLARRSTIESSLGRRLQLKEPAISPSFVRETPVVHASSFFRSLPAADVPFLSEPYNVADRLRAALQAISAPIPPAGELAFDPREVYVLRRERQDWTGLSLSEGTLVMESSFAHGWLNHYVSVNDAYRYRDLETESVTEQARTRLVRDRADKVLPPIVQGPGGALLGPVERLEGSASARNWEPIISIPGAPPEAIGRVVHP